MLGPSLYVGKSSEYFQGLHNADHIYFYLGDRLTDERVQVAQQAMANAETSLERLEGFISKIEDFHRSMNFLEVCTGSLFPVFYR